MLTKEEIKEAEGIEIRSVEVQELLGRVPSWIIRWGTTLFLVIILLMIMGSRLLMYPEIRSADVFLTTTVPPVELVARTSGKIENLLVADSQKVERHDHIAIIETVADIEDVRDVAYLLDSVKMNLTGDVFLAVSGDYDLGELQSQFSHFLKSYREYETFIKLGYHQKKIAGLQQEMIYYWKYYNRLNDESGVLLKELHLAQNQLRRDSVLFAQGVISSSDFEQAESKMLAKEFAYSETRTGLADAQIKISNIEQKILDLELAYMNEKDQKLNVLNEAIERLTAELRLWEQKHVLVAPVGGIVSFTRYWSEYQHVREGESVLTIVPEHPGDTIGKIQLSMMGAGKVRPGQRVNIKLDNYPFMEFGMLQGKIRSVSLVPNEDFYIAEISLPEGMVTNYGRRIGFKQNMPGRAEIITESMSLLQRILNPVKSVIRKQKSLKGNSKD